MQPQTCKRIIKKEISDVVVENKYAELFEKRLGCKIVKEDEMQCLIWGTNFLLNNIKIESFTDSTTPNAISPKELDGTSLGGGTFWGLCSLLTGVSDYDEMLEMTKNGQSNHVDLVVGDIYGTDYTKIGLSSDTIASSFGKVIYENEKKKISGEENIKKEDIAQSLLKMRSSKYNATYFICHTIMKNKFQISQSIIGFVWRNLTVSKSLQSYQRIPCKTSLVDLCNNPPEFHIRYVMVVHDVN
ncbi:hypothetical protein ACTFIW_003036 [Dictyostelium discoideum]